MLRLKGQYEKMFKEPFFFKLVVTDYSWALIHSVVEVLNMMSITSYAKLVYELAEDRLDNMKRNSTTLLISCVTHTMKRFTLSIKALSLTEFQYTYLAFCFSLLVNCTDLCLAGDYYSS